ncbi:Dephospho-CoA kinase [uncultured archaeon]|nr:Dephospho-CoA kinase [uncultured archaeon]
MIIGLTGENCAGKGTVASYLVRKSFQMFSLSDVIREELAAEGKEATRETLIGKGNELRKKFGPGILAKRVAAKTKQGENYVIDSIRNPAEVEELRKLECFTLIHISAPPELRFERMKKREREGDPRTIEAFKAIEEKELRGKDPSGQMLLETFKLADKVVVNDADFQRLYDTIDKILGEVSAKFKPARPSWDEYFMNIAREVASRSNCMKRHVAAVIVKEKRIVSTGYNGTPRGVKNCNEGGCPRCNSFSEGGKNLEECFCSHGEENSIVQAAYHGISVKDGTLYTTYSPCLMCSKMIINAGLKEVVYNAEYPLGESALRLLKEAGITVRKYSPGNGGRG